MDLVLQGIADENYPGTIPPGEHNKQPGTGALAQSKSA